MPRHEGHWLWGRTFDLTESLPFRVLNNDIIEKLQF